MSDRKDRLQAQLDDIQEMMTHHQNRLSELQNDWMLTKEELDKPDLPEFPDLQTLINRTRGMENEPTPCTLGPVRLKDILRAIGEKIEDEQIRTEEQEAADHLAAYIKATNPDAVQWQPTQAGFSQLISE